MANNFLYITKYLCAPAVFLALAMISSPASAQTEDEQALSQQTDAIEAEAQGTNPFDRGEFEKLFEGIFPEDNEPIAPEQLALGEQVAMSLLPQGGYRRMMGDTYDQILEPMLATISGLPIEEIAQISGLSVDEINIPDGANIADISAILDPSYQERQKVTVEVVGGIMLEVFDDIEPAMRNGLARAYARRFTAQEMTEMVAFFKTPTGSKYAAESLPIYASKEMLAASANMMPALFERMADVANQVEEKTADLPPVKSAEDLTGEERAELARLLGVSREDLGTQTPEEEY